MRDAVWISFFFLLTAVVVALTAAGLFFSFLLLPPFLCSNRRVFDAVEGVFFVSLVYLIVGVFFFLLLGRPGARRKNVVKVFVQVL